MTRQFSFQGYWYALVGWLCLVGSASGREFPFQLPGPAEAIAEITASAPGASWKVSGAEAALATVSLDGSHNQDIAVFHGTQPWIYRVFLGRLSAGTHRLTVERNERWSAPHAGLEVSGVKVTGVTPSMPGYRVIEHTPVLFARADTIGHFSDVPMLMWYEIFPRSDGETIQYSIVFSNEDSGTPTDALMARWGRATDIEYVYRVSLDGKGEVQEETFQGMEHDDRPFRGRKIGQHPLILVATPNNCFADTGFSPVQYHLAPVAADLSKNSREELMDRFPWTYKIMAEELSREGKIRPFGVSAGESISDPCNYLYLEMEADNKGSGLVVWVKLKDKPRWYSSHRGRTALVISRSGWYRTTVELSPGTRADSIESILIECIEMRDPRLSELEEGSATPASASTLRNISKVFFLDSEHRPGKNLLESHQEISLHPGDVYTFSPGAR